MVKSATLGGRASFTTAIEAQKKRAWVSAQRGRYALVNLSR